MGEVYRARDTKLDRDVALKVLPEAFTSDPDRLARFEREAKVLASLNHTNIWAHLRGVGGGVEGVLISLSSDAMDMQEGLTLETTVEFLQGFDHWSPPTFQPGLPERYRVR
jgi:serine/threonine protein kinase